jgi:hypothetical protein
MAQWWHLVFVFLLLWRKEWQLYYILCGGHGIKGQQEAGKL